MRIWKGTLNLRGAVTRGMTTPAIGKEATVRIVMDGDGSPVIDVATGVDPLGCVRWRVADVSEFDMMSVFRALAMTQPEHVEVLPAPTGIYAPGTK